MMILREQVPIQEQYSEIQIQTQLEHAEKERTMWIGSFKFLGESLMNNDNYFLICKDYTISVENFTDI